MNAARWEALALLVLALAVGCGDDFATQQVGDAMAAEVSGVDGGVDVGEDVAVGPLACSVDADCAALDDAAGCRRSRCGGAGTCVVVLAAEGAPCDDGEVCSLGERCSDGACGGGAEACGCAVDADCAALDDGDLCNGALRCDTAVAGGACVIDAASVPDCAGALAGALATAGACVEARCTAETGTCALAPLPDGGACDDGLPCSVDTVCGGGVCGGGVSICPCSQSADCAPLEDGDPCNGTLYCDVNAFPATCKINPATVVACPDEATACHASAWDPQTGTCATVALADGSACDDGSACTKGDVCAGGACTAGVDICTCGSDADCAAYEDGDLCNGTLFCNLTAALPTCQVNPATVVSCPTAANGDCIASVCKPQTGVCAMTAKNDNLPCDDGDLCSEGETCSGGACGGGKDLCACNADADCQPFEDGNVCNATLYCDKSAPPFACRVNPKTVVHCPSVDDTACLENRCNVGTGACQMTPRNELGPCDADGNPCTAGDACVKGLCVAGTNTCPCETTADCAAVEDGYLCNGTLYCDKLGAQKRCKVNPKTVVVCNKAADTACAKSVCDTSAGICKMKSAFQGHPCDADGTLCTVDDACKGGVCVAGTNVCTCKADADCGAFEDGNACNGTLYCDTSAMPFGCKVNPASVVSCASDGAACLGQGCDAKSGACVAVAKEDNAPCSDGNVCTVGDVCKDGACAAGPAVCGCSGDADCAGFEDGNLCNGTLYCDQSTPPFVCKIKPETVVSCPDAKLPCSALSCAPSTGLCHLTAIAAKAGKACEDGDPCSVGESCAGGLCVATAAKDCDDGNPCTNDGCVATAGCVHTPSAVLCDDGDACTNGDACKGGVCVPGSVKLCDDGNLCTVDACDAATGACTSAPAAGACDDDNACSGDDSCVQGGCVGKPVDCSDDNPCTTANCSATKGCVAVANSAGCDDGDVCTLAESCVKGACAGGSLVDCGDGNACTVDLCDPKKGCANVPISASTEQPAPCDDGNACTKDDVCAKGSCVGGENLCGCAKDSDCAAQEDGDPCNGTLYCDSSAAPFHCEVDPKSVVVCPTDGDTFCSHSVCKKETGFCGAVARNQGKACDADGDPCTGGDACVGGFCKAGAPIGCDDGNPCTDDACVKGKGCVATAAGNQAGGGVPCDDGNACTAGDVCKDKACVPGAVKTCDDDNACTTDACDAATGCTHVAKAGGCDDGDACTVGDVCQAGVCAKGSAASCDDGKACTDDGCDATKGCTHVANTKPCSDGDACTVGDVCKAGVCKAGAAKVCDDGNPCTLDACDKVSGACSTTYGAAPCDDGSVCTEGDVCKDGACVGAAINCDDNDVCTNDGCDGTTGCVHLANAKPCDDGNACTAGEKCAKGSCGAAVPIDCDDGEVCSKDGCDKLAGCTHQKLSGDATTAPCDDGNPCTAGDACQAGVCTAGANACTCTKDSDCASQEDGNACNGTLYCDLAKAPYACRVDPDTVVTCSTADNTACLVNTCAPKTGACALTPTNEGKPCDADGSVCTVGDACAAGSCKPGAPPDCDDDNPCTDDLCDALGGCGSVAVSGAKSCDDGSACTVGDACAAGACKPGAPAKCDDGNPCTDDGCDKAKGCTHAANTASCDDGDACTTEDLCVAKLCVGKVAPDCDDANPCTVDACDSAKGCTHAGAVNGDGSPKACDDGDACTTADACKDGACAGGAAPNCDDGNPCTNDGCAKASGCAHVANTSSCNDGNPCTATDACADKACVGQGPTNCDDGNACTDDSCSTTSGCTQIAHGEPCDDGDACTTGDLCKSGACVGGAPPSCDDGNACTTESCAPQSGCVSKPNAVSCNDGDACTTVDVCKDGACTGTSPLQCDDGNPCTNDLCLKSSGCTVVANSASCDDGDGCTVGDSCKDKACVAGAAKDCDDGELCTTDACDAATGNCAHVAVPKSGPSALACDDGKACSAGGACADGSCASYGKDKLFVRDVGYGSKAFARAVVATPLGYAVAGYFEGPKDDDATLALVDRAGTALWKRNVGVIDDDHDWAYGVAALADGGFALCGQTKSLGPGAKSLLLARRAWDGSAVWIKGYGGSGDESGQAIAQRADGSLIAVGWTKNNTLGGMDGWVVTADLDGNVLSAKTYGTGKDDHFDALVLVGADAVAVGSRDGGGDTDWDGWAVRLAADGAVVWNQAYGSEKKDYLLGAAAWSAGVVVAGHSEGASAGGRDGWIANLDLAGKLLWERRLGTSAHEIFSAVVVSPGGHAFAVGSFEKGLLDKDDAYVARVDVHGNVAFAVNAGGIGDDFGYAAVATDDGGVLVVGDTKSFGSDEDQLLLRLDAFGHSSCTLAGGCADLGAKGCDGGNPCTKDACAAVGGCSYSAFADGASCGGGKTCASGSCQ